MNGFWVSRLPLFQIADVDVICLLVFESWYPVIVDLQTLSIYLCWKFCTFPFKLIRLVIPRMEAWEATKIFPWEGIFGVRTYRRKS